MKPIPITAGKRIAVEFDYDQVVIVARKVGGGEHVTTYGKDKANCAVAAKMGNFFKHKLMGWPEPASPQPASPGTLPGFDRVAWERGYRDGIYAVSGQSAPAEAGGAPPAPAAQSDDIDSGD